MFFEKFIRVLYINLSSGLVRIYKREDLYPYLGGVGVASKLLEEYMRPELSPLDPEQPIILANGAATTVFPVITKTVAMFISPLTGELGESYAGGRLALTMLHAGFDAIVITGKSKNPSYISISEKTAEIKDARAFWGMSSDRVGQYIRQREPFSGKRSIIRIGPAGENLCSYASVCVDTYRHFGRLGLGAVFGSKNLKAVQVAGDRSIPIPDFKKYFRVYNELYKTVTQTEIMSKYHDAGTPINVEPLSTGGGLPTENLTATTFEHVDGISGDTFAKKNLVRKMACTGCPVGCIHIGQFRREFDHGYEYEAVSVGYDYELIFALGSYLGIKTSDEVLQLIEAVEHMGMDAMSTGVVLGWATEAFQSGLVTLDQTLVPLKMGETGEYVKAIYYIALCENDFYADLAKGVKTASTKYGGYNFGMQVAGNETAGYHTGYGSLMGALVGSRHSHLCNGGYSFDQSKPFDKDKLVEYLFTEEVERGLLNSLIICLFSRKVYNRENIIKALDCVGQTYTSEELDKIARQIYRTKLRIKQKLGFDIDQVKIPKRFFEVPSMTGMLKEEMTKEILSDFKVRCENLLASED
ncbi:MAG: aldehyde ferredoxin oxidoreductase N-terminal domain-containing protein [Saccharofermentanales bacterium]